MHAVPQPLPSALVQGNVGSSTGLACSGMVRHAASQATLAAMVALLSIGLPQVAQADFALYKGEVKQLQVKSRPGPPLGKPSPKLHPPHAKALGASTTERRKPAAKPLLPPAPAHSASKGQKDKPLPGQNVPSGVRKGTQAAKRGSGVPATDSKCKKLLWFMALSVTPPKPGEPPANKQQAFRYNQVRMRLP